MAQSQQIVAKQWEELVLATSDHDTDISFLFKEAYSLALHSRQLNTIPENR